MAYTSMQNAFRMVGKRVSLVGIVVEFTLPRETQGTDYGCKVRIVDPSRQENVLTVQFFASDPKWLPRINSYHDIICLRNVEITTFQEDIFATFNKKRSSFALFDGRSQTISSYQASLSFMRFSNDEKKLIADLQACLDGYQPFVGVNKFTRQLKEIEEEEVGDLICKVIHVCEIHEGWFLFVWDGTDCPPVNMSTSLRSDDALPPLQSGEVELGKSALENLPRFGTVLRVRIDKSFEGLYINLRTIGEWVKLRSLTFKVQSDRWYAELTHNSTMRLLTEETSIVIERMREYTAQLEPN